MNKYLAPILGVILAIVLSFTDYYSFGYILLIVLSLPVFRSFSILQSWFQRFVLSTTALLATIPIVGLACWLAGIPNLAIANMLGFIGVICLIRAKKQSAKEIKPIAVFSRVDIIGISVAVLPIVIILFSYFSQPNKTAALFQLTSEGWDNGSHILMLQDNSRENGYVYGDFETLKAEGRIIQGSNAYPQAWHLTTANFINGFGGNRFIPQNYKQTMVAYMVASIVWLALASYLIVLISTIIYTLAQHGRDKKTSWHLVASIAVLSAVSQVPVINASLFHGFTNYLGTIVLVLGMSLIFLELLGRKSNLKHQDHSIFSLAILFGTAAVLTWFLVAPAVALSIMIFSVFYIKNSNLKFITAFLRPSIITPLLIGALAMILQVYIFQKFSVVSGEDQLNTGVRFGAFSPSSGVFHVSPILYLLVASMALAGLLSRRINRGVYGYVVATVSPWLVMVFSLFLYQNATAGYNSYYFAKILGISLVVNTAVAIPLMLATSERYFSRVSKWSLPVASLCVVGLLFIGTGQDMRGFNKLFVANARTPHPVAAEVVSLLPRVVDGQGDIVVFTGLRNSDKTLVDHHGKLELRLTHAPIRCSYKITGHLSIEESLAKMKKCAERLKRNNLSLFVITTEDTRQAVKDLGISNIKIRNVSID